MILALWGRITGADKRQKYPSQQTSALGVVGDSFIAHPYGSYCDAVDGTLCIAIAPGVMMPVTVDRPADVEQGEPVFFHPATGARIIARNNGDLDILEGEGGGSINVIAKNVNVTAAESVAVNAPNIAFSGALAVDGDVSITGDLGVDKGIIGATVGDGTVDLVEHGHGIASGSSAPGPTKKATGAFSP